MPLSPALWPPFILSSLRFPFMSFIKINFRPSMNDGRFLEIDLENLGARREGGLRVRPPLCPERVCAESDPSPH